MKDREPCVHWEEIKMKVSDERLVMSNECPIGSFCHGVCLLKHEEKGPVDPVNMTDITDRNQPIRH